MRKLKRPDGILIEEYITYSGHFFEGGELSGHDNDVGEGHYTGRIAFTFRDGWKDGKTTRWYSKDSAPMWMQVLFREATKEMV